MLKVDLGDTQIWMQSAETMYLQSVDASLAGAEYPATNQLNVACVCAGLAFELLFKVLARAGGVTPRSEHQPSKAYKKIKEMSDKKLADSIENIFFQHGWDNVDELFDFLDDLSNPDRKYWGLPKSGTGCRHATFSNGGRKGVDSLREMHRDLSRLALLKINARNAKMEREEIWDGIDAIQY